MATIYVYSGAVGANNGSSWTDAYTTISAGVTAWTTADEVWVASDHAEVIGANTILSNASAVAATPLKIYSIDRSDDSYLPATTAQITSSGNFYCAFSTITEAHGLYIAPSANIYPVLNPTTEGVCRFYSCTFEVRGTTGDRTISITDSSTNLTAIFYNCHMIDAKSAGTCTLNIADVNVFMFGGSISIVNYYSSGGYMINLYAGANAIFYGADLSGTTASGVLLSASSNNTSYGKFYNCLMPSSSWSISLPTQAESEIINSDSNGNLDRYEKYGKFGNYMVATTAVYRDNGYSGIDNQVSWKVTKVGKVGNFYGIISPDLRAYVSTTGSKTITVEIAHDYTSLTDADIFLEVYYLGTASETLYSLDVSTSPGATYDFDPQVSGSSLTSSSETWTGASGLTKAKISKTLTINKAGIIAVRVAVPGYESGKFIYIDPKVTIS